MFLIQQNFYDGEVVNLKKNRWATLCKFLKWSLPFAVFFMFLLMSIATTHGMSASHLSTHLLHPFDTPIPTTIISSPTFSTPIFTSIGTSTPTLTPTPSLISTPTLIVTQTPIATQILQPQLTPNGTKLPVQTMVTETPTTATPASPIPTTIPTVTSKTLTMKASVTNQLLPNTEERNKVLNTFMLPLSIGTPLLLASGWMFWLIRRRQINQHKQIRPGIFDNTQPALWVNDYEFGSDFNALHYATGASGTWPVPIIPQIPDKPITTSPFSFTQSTQTSSELPSIPTSFRQLRPTKSSNQPARSIQDENRLPLAKDSLNLPAQLIETRESNKYGPVLTLPPMVQLYTPPPYISSLLQERLVVSQPTHPPSTQNDPLLSEVMRQAQMGLFVVLGRER